MYEFLFNMGQIVRNRGGGFSKLFIYIFFLHSKYKTYTLYKNY